MKKRFAMSAALVAALSLVGVPAAFAQDEGTDVGNPAEPPDPATLVIERSAEVAGQTYQDWINEYGKWFFWERTPDNPPPDAMKDCNGGQPMGDVFFIPHTQFGNIDSFDCELRSDQHVLLWLGGGMGFVEDGDTVEATTQQFFSGQEHSYGFEYSVNGVSRPAGAHTVFHPAFYTVDLAEDNLFGLPAGPREVTLVGSFVMLEPFEAGEHQVMVANRTYHPELGDARAYAISNLTVTDAASALAE